MLKGNPIYKCELCGNMVELVNSGSGTLVCCGQNMTLLEEKTADSSIEKHVPLIEKIQGGYRVTVGSTLHPMKDEHAIQWIELIADGKSHKQILHPGDQPIAEFCIQSSRLTAREYCNLHGLWESSTIIEKSS